MSKYIYILFVIVTSITVASEEIIYEKKIHTDSVDSLCVNATEIISASFDRTIKKTNNKTSKIIGKHKDWVRKVICDDVNIISASNDGMISIWNNLKKLKSVQAHSWWINDIDLNNDKLVSVSLDETVKVWSFPELKLLYSHKLIGSNKHHSVIINASKAFIGSTHGLIYVLELNNYSWLKPIKINDHYSTLMSATKSNKYVFFGSSDGFLSKILASSPNNISKLKVSDFAVKAIAYKQGTIYAGDDNGVIRKINVINFEKPITINQFSEAVRTVAVDNNLIYAGYDKGYIRVFKDLVDEAAIE